MLKFTRVILLLSILHPVVSAQSNPDDFWLNNGFLTGDTVFTNSGFFYDDGGFDVYDENQDWDVTFCSENSNPITLDFSGFKTHFGGTVGDGTYLQYDYMTIDFGTESYYAYHNDTPEFSFTSQDGCISIGFHSDGDGMIDSGWVAEIYALPPPFNNDPSGAQELTVGNVCSPSFYTNKGAYNTTGLGSPPCKTYFGGDVWFTVVVPASGTLKLETFAGTLSYAILDIYSSSDATILDSERISCVDDGGAMPSVTLSSPTISPGERLYIRLFGEQAKSGLFGICASDISAPVTGFTGPGGVGDSISLAYWYTPENGILNASGIDASNTEQVTTWEDRSGNELHLVQPNSSLRALFVENAINGFGGLQFDGTDDLYELETGSGDAPMHWFLAGAFSGSQRQSMISIGDALLGKTASISRHTDGRYFSFTDIDRYGPALVSDQFYLLHASHQVNVPYHFLELDGLSQSVDGTAFALESDGSLQVGASWDNSDPFNGILNEIIQFRKTLNAAQEIIVNNYLSAKYNIDLDANNLYAHKATHYYEVAGIGRVDVDNTHTKAESAGVLSVSGANDLDDGEFLFLGHNNGDFLNWSGLNVPSGDTNIVRLERTWRASLSGDPGTLTLGLRTAALPALPPGYTAYNILIDGDGDFTSGSVNYGPFEIGDELIVNNIALNHGDYLALAAVRPVISFTAASSEEFESIPNPLIQIELNYAFSEIIEIDYSVIAATATAGTDYSLLPGSVFINPGEKTVNIVPLIIDDALAEVPDEYFDVEISTTTAGVQVSAISSIRHTILNDDLEIDILASDTIIGACAGSSAQLIGLAKGTGPFTYSWTPATGLSETNNDTVIANPASTTTYTLEVIDLYGLSKVKDIEIEVVPLPGAPSVTINGPSVFCEGDSVNLSTTSGFANYLWSTGQSTESIWVKSTGDYNVIVSDSFGCASPVSVDASITVNPNPGIPAITLMGASTFCEGDSTLLIAPTGFSAYLWSDGSVNDSLTVKTSGSYTLTVSNAFGCSSPESNPQDITVLSNPLKPTITAGGATTFCSGDSVSLSAPGGFNNYIWSDGSTSQDITVNSSGTFDVYVEDANGCVSPISDPVTVLVNAIPGKPFITASTPTTFCEGGSVLLEPSPGFTIYEWSDGILVQDRLVDLSGEFAVRVTDNNGCVSEYSDSVEVIENSLPEKPVINPSGPLEFCEGDSVLLVAPDGFVAYNWSNGASNDSIIIKSNGTFTVSVSDANLCTSEDSDPITILVNTNPVAPLLSASGPTTFCEGESVEISATSGYAVYNWSDGGTGEIRTIDQSASLSVTVSDINACVSPVSNSIDVVVNPLPDQPLISPEGPIFLITGDSVILSSTDAASYLWNPGGESAKSISVKSSGDYYVIVENIFGCPSIPSAPVSVTVSDFLPPPEVSVEGSLSFCPGSSVVLSGPDGFSAYNWSNGLSGQEAVFTESGQITLIVTDSNGNTSLPSTAIDITVLESPVLGLISAMEPACFGEESGELEIEASGGQAPYIFSWTGYSETGVSLAGLGAGSYEVRVEDENSCGDTLLIQLEQPEALEVIETITDAYCPDFADGEIALSINGGIEPYTVDWEEGGNMEVMTDLRPGEYSYQLYDANNCSYSSTLTLSYETDFCFEVPEIITPNDDGYNDFWHIEGLEVYPDVIIEVYDRWGKRVFYSEGHDIYFDGTFDGKELPMESYHYVIDLNNGTERIIGNLTIIR